MRRRRFKDKAVQAAYDFFMETRPEPESQKARGSAGNAYFVGRTRPRPDRPFSERGSIAYGAWAAGIDIWREEQRS